MPTEHTSRYTPRSSHLGALTAIGLVLGGCAHSPTGTAIPQTPAAPAPIITETDTDPITAKRVFHSYPATTEICDDHIDYGICALTRAVEGAALQTVYFNTLALRRLSDPQTGEYSPFLAPHKNIAELLRAQVLNAPTSNNGKPQPYTDFGAARSALSKDIAAQMGLPAALTEIMSINFSKTTVPDAQGCFGVSAKGFSFYTDKEHQADLVTCPDKSAPNGWRSTRLSTRKR